MFKHFIKEFSFFLFFAAFFAAFCCYLLFFFFYLSKIEQVLLDLQLQIETLSRIHESIIETLSKLETMSQKKEEVHTLKSLLPVEPEPFDAPTLWESFSIVIVGLVYLVFKYTR